MNRRSFLRSLAVGTARALAIATVPASVVKAICGEHAARESAVAIMTRKYRSAMAVLLPSERPPRYMVVGGDLFAAYEGQLMACERFIDVPRAGIERTLAFKLATVVQRGCGWHCSMSHTYPRLA